MVDFVLFGATILLKVVKHFFGLNSSSVLSRKWDDYIYIFFFSNVGEQTLSY